MTNLFRLLILSILVVIIAGCSGASDPVSVYQPEQPESVQHAGAGLWGLYEVHYDPDGCW
jgi:PBP1b-binding outer membrane lipoprotein LpoB